MWCNSESRPGVETNVDDDNRKGSGNDTINDKELFATASGECLYITDSAVGSMKECEQQLGLKTLQQDDNDVTVLQVQNYMTRICAVAYLQMLMFFLFSSIGEEGKLVEFSSYH